MPKIMDQSTRPGIPPLNRFFHPFGVLLAIALLLAACAPSGATAPASFPGATAASITKSGIQVDAGECNSVATRPTPDPATQSRFPQVSPSDYSNGPLDAPVTIIEYNDFQCPSCSALAAALKEMKQKYGDQINVVYRYFPLLTVHDKTGLATRATEAAARQGKFWEMHDLLFEKQANWKDLEQQNFQPWVVEQAKSLGLDAAQFETDMKSAEAADVVQKAWEGGQALGLPGVPVMLVNGQVYAGPRDAPSLDYIIGLLVLGERQFTTCPDVVIDPDRQYIATLKTAKGEIKVKLYANWAHKNVNNFVFLARKGWYDNITFYRVQPGFMAQSGDPSETGAGNPGYFINDETLAGLKFDRPGMLAMQNVGSNTNGSQFFITMVPAPQLDGKYTIIGEVVSGLEVLKALSPREPLPGTSLPDGDALISVTIEEK